MVIRQPLYKGLQKFSSTKVSEWVVLILVIKIVSTLHQCTKVSALNHFVRAGSTLGSTEVVRVGSTKVSTKSLF